ncbi:MAG: heme exporter protein CcmD [Gammaproteobacteria bacterium]
MLNQLITMGGYGMYVWPAYGITFAVFAINLFIALKEKKQIKKLLKTTQHEVNGES